MQQPAAHTNLTLNDVKQHFDHWRTTRTKRGKIPDYLWEKVQRLVGRYSLTTITDSLSINTNQIREHIDLNHVNTVNFIEVPHQASTDSSMPLPHHLVNFDEHKKTCIIELHRSNGGMLKINDYPIESLHLIINKFVGQ